MAEWGNHLFHAGWVRFGPFIEDNNNNDNNDESLQVLTARQSQNAWWVSNHLILTIQVGLWAWFYTSAAQVHLLHYTEAFRKLTRIKPETTAKRLIIYKGRLNPSLQLAGVFRVGVGNFHLGTCLWKPAGQEICHTAHLPEFTQIKMGLGQIITFEGA